MTDPSKQPNADSSPDESAPSEPKPAEISPASPEPTSESSDATAGPPAQPPAPGASTEAAAETPASVSPAPSAPQVEETTEIPPADATQKLDTAGFTPDSDQQTVAISRSAPTSPAQPDRPVASGSAPVRPMSPAAAPTQQFSPPPPPAPPQATTPGYTEPIPGVRRPHGSRRGAVIIAALIALVVLFLCGGVGYMFWQKSADDNAHKVGKCVKQAGDKAKPISCSSADAYKIIKRINHTTSDSSCPTTETELYFVNKTRQYVLCLKRNNPPKGA